MAERNTRETIELDEFVLVNSEGQQVFRDMDVTVRPVAIGKTGPEFEVVDKSGQRIGIVHCDQNFEFDITYSNSLSPEVNQYFNMVVKNQMLKADVMQMIKEQEEREQQERAQEDVQREQRRVEESKSNKDKNSDIENTQEYKSPEDNNVSPTKQELQEQGFDVSAYTVIKDKEMLDEIAPGMYYDKNSVVVAKVDGKITVLARVAGEENFEEIAPRSENTSIGQVTAFQYNKGYEEEAGTEITFTDNGSYRIRENNSGQLEVGRVHINPQTGEKTVTNVDSDMAYPTIDEKNRVDTENAIDTDSKQGVLSQEEIDIELLKLDDELREDYVKKDERVKEGITIEELKEIISECEEQLRDDHHEPSPEPRRRH